MLNLISRADPHAWLVTLPLLAGLWWAWYLPAEHRLKQTWQALEHSEAAGLSGLGLSMQSDRPLRVAVFWALTTGLAGATLGSLGVYLGLFS